MNIFQRLFLIVTMILLLFGSLSHVLPAGALCECLSQPQKDTNSSNFDLCLVCQMQSGMLSEVLPIALNHEIASQVSVKLALSPLEYVFPVLHPPIV